MTNNYVTQVHTMDLLSMPVSAASKELVSIFEQITILSSGVAL